MIISRRISIWSSLDDVDVNNSLAEDEEEAAEYHAQAVIDIARKLQPAAAQHMTPQPFPISGPSRLTHSTAAPDVPSPTDTPSRRSSRGEGTARRDDPATPLPLGESTFAKLRQKKDFQTMSKHFELFEKSLAREVVRAHGIAGKGKGRQVESSSSTAAKILDGCRICLPLDAKGGAGISKHKDRWAIVSAICQS